MTKTTAQDLRDKTNNPGEAFTLAVAYTNTKGGIHTSDIESGKDNFEFEDESLLTISKNSVIASIKNQFPFSHVMCDLETLGKQPGDIIVTAAFAQFDLKTGAVGEKLLINIDAASSEKAGLKINADTIMWWMNQSQEAQKALISSTALTLPNALVSITNFCKNTRACNEGSSFNLWGNGSMFDNAFLEAAYDVVNEVYPWSFWEHRDVRTLVQLAKEFGFDVKKETKMAGTAHNALDDVLHQIKYCSKAYNIIAGA